jgi:hypothetical protein
MNSIYRYFHFDIFQFMEYDVTILSLLHRVTHMSYRETVSAQASLARQVDPSRNAVDFGS